MSTKATIAHGENFRFYHEVMDEDHVYLEPETTHLRWLWTCDAAHPDTHLGDDQTSGRSAPYLVNCTDEALLAMVEAAVDARIVRYQEALRTHPDRAGLMSIAGALVYGGAEDPRAKQIARHGILSQRAPAPA